MKVQILIISKSSVVDVRYVYCQSDPKACGWQFVSLLSHKPPGELITAITELSQCKTGLNIMFRPQNDV